MSDLPPAPGESFEQSTAVSSLAGERGPGSRLLLRRRRWPRLASVFVAVWAATALGLISGILAAKGLGPRDYGSVIFVVALAGLIAALLDLSLDEAVMFHGTRALQGEDDGRLRRLLRTALLVDGVNGLLVFLLLSLAAGPLVSLISADIDPDLLRLAAFSALATTLEGTTAGALLIAGRADIRSWAMAAGLLFRVLFVAVAVALGAGAPGVLVAFALASVAGSALLGFLCWRLAWRKWAKPTRGTGGWSQTHELLVFGAHTSVASSVAAGNKGLVPVIVGGMAGPTAVGLLDIAMFPVGLATVVTAPLRIWLFPEQARLAAEGKIALLRRTIRKYTLGLLALGVPAAVAGWFALPWLIHLFYGEAFDGAVGPARVLLLAALAHLATSWTRTFPGAIGRPKIKTGMSLLQVVTMVVLLVLLSPHGVLGAAIAISASALLLAGAWWPLTRHLLRREDGAGEGTTSAAYGETASEHYGRDDRGSVLAGEVPEPDAVRKQSVE